MTKLKKIGAEPYETKVDENGRVYEARYRLKFSQVSFRRFVERTKEQKQEIANRLKKKNIEAVN